MSHNNVIPISPPTTSQLSYTFKENQPEDKKLEDKKPDEKSKDTKMDVEEPKKMEEFIPNDISPLGFTRAKIGIIFIGLMLALFLAALDQTIVATALPSIVSDFQRLDLYSWVVIAYLLTSTAVIPLTGKFSDIFGRKILFMGCVVVFLVGSILCGVSPNMESLIVFRAFQGIGGGAIITLTLVIIGDIVTLRERGRWVGLMGMTFAVASVIGPVLGGVITSTIGWRWIFYINIPIGIVTLVVIQFALKLPTTNSGGAMAVLKGIDYFGILTVVIGIILILLGTSLGGSTFAWNSGPIITFYVFVDYF